MHTAHGWTHEYYHLCLLLHPASQSRLPQWENLGWSLGSLWLVQATNSRRKSLMFCHGGWLQSYFRTGKEEEKERECNLLVKMEFYDAWSTGIFHVTQWNYVSQKDGVYWHSMPCAEATRTWDMYTQFVPWLINSELNTEGQMYILRQKYGWPRHHIFDIPDLCHLLVDCKAILNQIPLWDGKERPRELDIRTHKSPWYRGKSSWNPARVRRPHLHIIPTEQLPVALTLGRWPLWGRWGWTVPQEIKSGVLGAQSNLLYCTQLFWICKQRTYGNDPFQPKDSILSHLHGFPEI